MCWRRIECLLKTYVKMCRSMYIVLNYILSYYRHAGSTHAQRGQTYMSYIVMSITAGAASDSHVHVHLPCIQSMQCGSSVLMQADASTCSSQVCHLCTRGGSGMFVTHSAPTVSPLLLADRLH